MILDRKWIVDRVGENYEDKDFKQKIVASRIPALFYFIFFNFCQNNVVYI
jgi:hypothetical protein